MLPVFAASTRIGISQLKLASSSSWLEGMADDY
jgi:hypothetical protein